MFPLIPLRISPLITLIVTCTAWSLTSTQAQGDLLESLAALNPHPTREIRFRLPKDGLPPGGHFQGVQQLGKERYLISGSSDGQSYLLMVDTSDGTSSLIPLLEDPWRHAGGFQLLDERFLAIGLEDNQRRDRSRLWILDTHALPGARPVLEITRQGLVKRSTAGALALAPLPDGGHLLLVGTWDCDTLDAYRSPELPPAGPSSDAATPWGTWSAAEADRSNWSDPHWGSYQNLHILRQPDGRLCLLGFCRDQDGDRLDVFHLRWEEGVPINRRLQKRASYRFHPRATNFLAGAGLSRTPDGDLVLLSCSHRDPVIEIFEETKEK